MQRSGTVICVGFFALCLGLALTSCQSNPEVKANDKSIDGKAAGGADSVGSAATAPDKSDAPTSQKASGWAIKAEDVQKITGMAYETANQLADFPNIKHWEFRMSAHSVSLLIATGTTATERMNNSKLTKHTVVSGLGGEAIWEPVQGRLTVLADGRCAEVRISKSHGDEAKRIELSKSLATLLLDQR